MKKILIAGLAVLILGSLAWLLAFPRAGTGYPTSAVESVLAGVSSSSGAEIVESRLVGGVFRRQARDFEALRLNIDRSLGRPVYDTLASYRLVQGSSRLEVRFHRSAHDTGRIEIVPEPGAIGLAADLHAAFVKAFPEIRCKVVGP